jgi:hypothetical protein
LAFGDDHGLRRWLRGVIAGDDGRAAESGGTTSGGAGCGWHGRVWGALRSLRLGVCRTCEIIFELGFGFSWNRGLSGSFFNTSVNSHASHPVAPGVPLCLIILLLLFGFLR